MKKLEMNQMENLEAGIKGRSCFLLGLAAVASIGLGPISAIGWGTAVSIGAGAGITGMASDCF
jgi:hypothetical protein